MWGEFINCHGRSRAPGFSRDWWIGPSLWNFTTLPISFISGAPLWPFRQFVFVIVAYSLTQWQVPWSLEINSCQGHSFFSWAALSFTTHTTMRPRVRKPTLWDPPSHQIRARTQPDVIVPLIIFHRVILTDQISIDLQYTLSDWICYMPKFDQET